MKIAYVVSAYWTTEPIWGNVKTPLYIFHSINDSVVNVSKSRYAHSKVEGSNYVEYSFGNHGGAQAYTYDLPNNNAADMYAKFEIATNGENSIVDNPSIQIDKANNILIIDGEKYRLDKII